MYTHFKKFFITLFFLKCFLLPVCSMDDSGASGSGSGSATAPVVNQGALEDPRMHVSSVALYDGEDVSWFNDVKRMVVAQKEALEVDRNTVFMRFGFLVQKGDSEAQLIFPKELDVELRRTCFISGFQHVDPKDGIIFCSLKDVFPNDRYPDWTTYRKTLRGIIELRVDQSLNLQKYIERREKTETKINFYRDLLSQIDLEVIKVRMLAKIPPSHPSIPPDIDPLESTRKAVRENPIEFVRERKLEEQKCLDNLNMRISDLRRLIDIEDERWGEKFFHSEQAGHFYLMKYFSDKNKCRSFCEFLGKNLSKYKIVVIADVCTYLNMCKNCAKTYYTEAQLKIHYMSNILQALKAREDLRLMIRASCLRAWTEDPLPAITTTRWDSPFIGHLSPSQPT